MSAWLTRSLETHADRAVIHDAAGAYTYADLAADVARWRTGLLREVAPLSIVVFDGDYCRGAVSLMLKVAPRRKFPLASTKGRSAVLA